MKKLLIAAALMAGITGVSAEAHAYVVNFESLAHADDQIVQHGATYVENGYLFLNTATEEASGFAPSFSTLGSQVYGYSGSTALVNDNWGGQTILKTTNGATFNLSSISIAALYPVSTPDNSPISIQFNGIKANGTTVSQTFTASGDFGIQAFLFGTDFNNLVSANWDQLPNAYQFDNVDVNATPIPAAAWLLGSGLLGLVGMRRRQQ